MGASNAGGGGGDGEKEEDEEDDAELDVRAEMRSAGLLSGAAGGEAEAAAPFVFEVDKAYSGKRWDGVRREWVDDTE